MVLYVLPPNQNKKTNSPPLSICFLYLLLPQIKEQHRGDQMTPGPKSQLLAGIVVDTVPGPVSIVTIYFLTQPWSRERQESLGLCGLFHLMGGRFSSQWLLLKSEKPSSPDGCFRFHHVSSRIKVHFFGPQIDLESSEVWRFIHHCLSFSDRVRKSAQ